MPSVMFVSGSKIFFCYLQLSARLCNSYTMVVRLYVKIIHELKRVDYLTYEGRSICNENSPVNPTVLYLHTS